MTLPWLVDQLGSGGYRQRPARREDSEKDAMGVVSLDGEFIFSMQTKVGALETDPSLMKAGEEADLAPCATVIPAKPGRDGQSQLTRGSLPQEIIERSAVL
ncbi:unnamed protein product [Symbiodinium necroappetens]|uniref:Uncharacterized protein n=1 Tax=Symbiodinium necroappetens TaxID=1628268 RepID=A0A812K0W7_9DINO|nr:unnamed protein product [Symbiodinium necroappetens]